MRVKATLGDFNPDSYDIELASRWLKKHFGEEWYNTLTEDQIEMIDIQKESLHLVTMLGTPVSEIWSLMPEGAELNLYRMRRYGFRAIQKDTHAESVAEGIRLNVMWRALIYKLRSD